MKVPTGLGVVPSQELLDLPWSSARAGVDIWSEEWAIIFLSSPCIATCITSSLKRPIVAVVGTMA